MKMTYETKTVPISAVWPDPENARVHDQINLDTIRASIQAFGQAIDLVIQKSSGKIIGGNGTYSVLKDMGRELVTIKEVDCNDIEAKALGIALNRAGDLARWNDSKLTETLLQLQNESQGMVYSAGYSDQALSQLVQALDVTPPSADAAVTNQGQEEVTHNTNESNKPVDGPSSDNREVSEDEKQGTFAVAVFCNTKKQRKELMKRLEDEGYEVKESKNKRPE